MTDREKYLIILDRFYRGRGASLLTKDESEALDYAISSIKTDLKYDLLYEETTHIADADKKIESTTKNDLAVDVPDNNVGKIDYISRQVAIDAVKRIHPVDTDYDCTLFDKVDVMYVLSDLPSVTPQNQVYPLCEDCHTKMDEVRRAYDNAMKQESILDKLRAEVENINVWAMRYEPDAYLDQRPQIVQKVKKHIIEIIDKYKAEIEPQESEDKYDKKIWDDVDKQEIAKSVVLLDVFTKTYCRYQNDYERFDDLKFRCDECPFSKPDGSCMCKVFKNKYAPDYQDFGSMGDL